MLFVLLSLFAVQKMDAQSPLKKLGIDSLKHIPVGLKVGDSAPDFKYVSQSGDTVKLQDLYSKQAVIIMFYRGYWCPVCNAYFKQLSDSIPEIEQRGAKLLMISPQVEKYTDKTRQKHHPSFELISDSTTQIGRSYDVMFRVTKAYKRMIKMALLKSIEKANGGVEEANLPVPATFIINRKGVIVYRQFDYDYHNRASVKDIIEVLDTLKK